MAMHTGRAPVIAVSRVNSCTCSGLAGSEMLDR